MYQKSSGRFLQYVNIQVQNKIIYARSNGRVQPVFVIVCDAMYGHQQTVSIVWHHHNNIIIIIIIIMVRKPCIMRQKSLLS